MNIKDFKFKLSRDGKSAILTFDDLYGYEGEVCGVLIKWGKEYDYIPYEFQGELINENSGYDYKGLDESWDIDYVDAIPIEYLQELLTTGDFRDYGFAAGIKKVIEMWRNKND